MIGRQRIERSPGELLVLLPSRRPARQRLERWEQTEADVHRLEVSRICGGEVTQQRAVCGGGVWEPWFATPDIEGRIVELQSVRDVLVDLSEHCHDDDRPECPILKGLEQGNQA